MRFFESYIASHEYKFLPAYSKFLLDNFLEPLVQYQLKISKEINLPILERLAHMTHEQVVEMGVRSMKEYLCYLADNKAKELVEIFLKRWKADQLSVIGKSDLIAEDVTLLNYTRARAFRNFISDYTNDVAVVLELVDELDSFFTGATTAAFNTYIQILREDITVQQQALLEAQRMAAVGNFEWNLVTNQTKTSPETDRIFEMGNEGFSTFIEHVYPADKELVENAMSRALNDGSYECEYRFQNTGPLKHIWAKGFISFENNKPCKFFGTIQDITQRKKAEQELIEKTIALERSNESLQQFAFVASHDLQEPIRQISTVADIVMSTENNLSEGSRKSLQKVVNYAIRMRQMIDDILAYSTLRQWEGSEEFCLNDILKFALENLEQKILEKKAFITYKDLPRIRAVPSQIQQLLQNLMSNALKFSRPGVSPEINVSYEWRNKEDVDGSQVHAAEKYLNLIIQDNGIGFDQQFANKIFGLFSRLHNKKDYQGSGIGLAIAKKIAENHGGNIYATSKEGEGARFVVVLPQ